MADEEGQSLLVVDFQTLLPHLPQSSPRLFCCRNGRRDYKILGYLAILGSIVLNVLLVILFLRLQNELEGQKSLYGLYFFLCTSKLLI